MLGLAAVGLPLRVAALRLPPATSRSATASLWRNQPRPRLPLRRPLSLRPACCRPLRAACLRSSVSSRPSLRSLGTGRLLPHRRWLSCLLLRTSALRSPPIQAPASMTSRRASARPSRRGTRPAPHSPPPTSTPSSARWPTVPTWTRPWCVLCGTPSLALCALWAARRTCTLPWPSRIMDWIWQSSTSGSTVRSTPTRACS
mmetsp:Transcript_55001/g.155899  ORF Transcript_55001/g.155899 Transcript_55001/m.155899 type:complete len:201 (-) Transcript_55001:648-1250(-)